MLTLIYICYALIGLIKAWELRCWLKKDVGVVLFANNLCGGENRMCQDAYVLAFDSKKAAHLLVINQTSAFRVWYT